MRTKKEFEAAWPSLFTDVRCGFYCPDGWTDLVWKLLSDIEFELEGDLSDFKMVQVKEKFGGLRFYYSYPKGADPTTYDYIHQLVEQAEGESWGICLTCGTKGGVTTGNSPGSMWITSQCDPCREAESAPKSPRRKA